MERYSYSILRETGEFAVNLTTRSLVRAADYCGVRSGRDVDKFAQMKLTPQPCRVINAPMIGESPVSLECKTRQVLELGSHHMFVAEVVGVNVEERLLDGNGKLCLEKADLVVYSHGNYCRLGELVGTFGFSVKKKIKKKSFTDRQAPGDRKRTKKEKEI